MPTAQHTIEGRYVLKHLLGEGSMGLVYVAEDTVGKHLYALKQLKPPVSPQALLQKLFSNLKLDSPGADASLGMIDSDQLQREFMHMSALVHPNLIEVYDLDTDGNGSMFLLMELLKGQSLQAVISGAREAPNCTPVALTTVMDYAVQILRGLAFLHARGFIHCDIKPANLFVCSDGRVKILDYGLMQKGKAAAGAALGTRAYSAPEVLAQGRSSVQSDMYSLGIVLLELCSTFKPHALSLEDLLNGVLEERLINNSAALPATWRNWLLRLLHRKAALRFQSAEEALTALFQVTDMTQAQETAATTQSYILSAKLLGRDAELQDLKQAFDKLHANKGDVKLIAGESGIGKSRLCAEFAKYVKISGGKFISGHFYDNSLDVHSALREILSQIAPIVSDELLQRYKNEIVYFVPLPTLPGETESQDQSPDSRDLSSTYHLIMAFLREVAAELQRPLVLLFEDLHFLQDFAFFNIARERATAGSLLILGTVRDDEVDRQFLEDWQLACTYLSHFPRSFLRRLAGEIFVGDQPNEFLLHYLEQHTSGNPFFIEQFLLELVRCGAIRKQGNKWEVLDIDVNSLHIPAVEHLLDRRLTGLSSHEITYMQLLAACTHDAPTHYIKHLFDSSVYADLQESLLRKHVISRHGTTVRAYHQHIKRYFYERIADKPSIHSTLAHLFEQYAAGELQIIAYHYMHSTARAKKLHYLESAAEQARNGNNQALAIQFYTTLLDILQPHTQLSRRLVKALYNMSQSLMSLGSWKELEPHLDKVMALAQPDTDDELMCRLHLTHANYFSMQSQQSAALQAALRARPHAVAAGNCELEVISLHVAGVALARLGRYEDALIECTRALDMLKALNAAPTKKLTLMGYIATLHQRRNDRIKAYQMHLACLNTSEQLSDRETMAIALYNLGILNLHEDSFQKGREFLERSMVLHKMLGNKRGIAITLNSIANSHAYEHRYPLAFEYLRSSQKISAAIGDVETTMYSLNFQARICVIIGNYDEAWELLEQQQDMAYQHNNPLMLNTNYFVRSMWYKHQGEYANAEKQLLSMQANAKNLGSYMLAHTNRLLGVLYIAMSKHDLALKHLLEALEEAKATPNVSHIAETTTGIAHIFLKQCKWKKARHYAQEAMNHAESFQFHTNVTFAHMFLILAEYHCHESDSSRSAALTHSTERLEALAENSSEQALKAETYFQLWKLHLDAGDASKSEKFRRLALHWFETVVSVRPSFEFFEKIRELEGKEIFGFQSVSTNPT